jgi:TolA-binding protein
MASRLVIIFCLAAVALRFAAAAGPEQELLSDATALIQEGKGAEAKPKLQQIVNQFPDSGAAGDALVLLGNLDYPRADFFSATHDPLPPGDAAAAEKNYLLAAKNFPQGSRTPEALYKLGLLRYDFFIPGRNPAEAEKMFETLLRGYPNSDYAPRALLGSGLTAEARGDGIGALQFFALAAATLKNPDEAGWASYFLGRVEGRMGRYGDALVHLGRAQQSPAAAPAARQLAALALRMQSFATRPYKPDPAFKPQFPANIKGNFTALAATSTGVAALESRSGVILRFSATGATEKNLTFPNPTDIAWDPARGLLISEEQIAKIGDAPGFKPLAKASDGSPVELSHLIAIAPLPGREVAIVDDRKGTLYRFKENGTFDGAVFETEGHIDDLAVDSLGRYWVMDRRSKAAYLVSPAGRLLASVLGTGPEQELQRPAAISLDGFDHLWLLDEKASRLDSFDAEGKPLYTFALDTLCPGAQAMSVDPGGVIYLFSRDNNALVRLQ